MNQWPKIDRNPLPNSLAGLPTVTAEPWFCIDPDPGMCIEGPAADAEGNLYVCVAVPPPGPAPKIVKITRDKVMTDFYCSDGSDLPVGIAIHRDGRLFVAAMFGGFTVLNPDGTLNRRIIPRYDDGELANPNDCVFDEKGNLYFTDYKGSIDCPNGAVCRLEADSDYTRVTKIVGNMMMPNGISFSPDWRTLWVAESNRNAIVQIRITEDGQLPKMGESVNIVWYGVGLPMPDGNKVDADGNCYQARMRGGHVLITNPQGTPIANVVVPRRGEGVFDNTSNLVLDTCAQEGFLLAFGSEGIWVLKFPTLAPAQKLFFQQEDKGRIQSYADQ